MTVKFATKNVAILGKKQVDESTPATPVGTDALAVTSLVGTVTRETEAFQYLGDDLDRDEETVLKDTSIDITADPFMPCLGTLDPGMTVAETPYNQWFEACGATMTVDPINGFVNATNKVAITEFLTIDYLLSSPEATGGDQKRYRSTACRGTVDITLEAGSKTKLQFKLLGNDSAPTMETAVVPNFGDQKFNVGAVVRLQNMLFSNLHELSSNQTAGTITDITGDGTTAAITITTNTLLDTEMVTIAGTTNYDGTYVINNVAGDVVSIAHSNSTNESSGTATKFAEIAQQMCINNAAISNAFGFEYERYLLTCQEGFGKQAAPTDVTMTALEDEVGAGADFDPEANIENFFYATISYGTGAGKNITMSWNKLQLANVSDTEIGNYRGKSMAFRNTRNFDIDWS